MSEIPLTHAGAASQNLADILSPTDLQPVADDAGAAPTIFASLLEQAHETDVPSPKPAVAWKGCQQHRSETRAPSSLTRQAGSAPRSARISTSVAARLATAGSRPLTNQNTAAAAAAKPPRSAPLGKTAVALPPAPSLTSSFPGAKTTTANNRNSEPAPSKDAVQDMDAPPSASHSNQESDMQPLPLSAPENAFTATAQNQEVNWPALRCCADISLAQPVLTTTAFPQARVSATPNTGDAPSLAPTHVSQPVEAESVPEAPRMKPSSEAGGSGAPTQALEQPLPGSANQTSVTNAAAAATELATPNHTHPVDLFSNIQSADSSQSPLAPMAGADGMSAALQDGAMQKMPDRYESSSPAGQNLPVAASLAFARSSERDRKPDFASLPLSTSSTSTTTVLPIALSGPLPAPTASPEMGGQTTSSSLAHRSIEDLILSFPRQDSRSVSVVLTPDANTQISVQVKMQHGHLQAQAVLDRGDFGALKADWGNLQNRLADHGVRLAPLTSGADEQTSFGSENSLSRQQQRDVQTENDAPSQNANKPQAHPSAAPAATAHRREWWA